MKFFNRFIDNKNNSERSSIIKKNIKIIYGVIAIIAISNLSACVGYFSDRAHSERLFEQYCHEEGRVGQFIYERVALGDEYFRPIPKDEVELRRIANSYYIDNKNY